MKHLTTLLILSLLLLPIISSAAETQVVKEETVRRVITDFIQRRTEGLGLEILIKKMDGVGELELPSGNISYDVLAPGRWEGWGNASLALVVRVDDRVVKNLPIHVDVASFTDMVVAARPLERGYVIREGDVILQRRELSPTSGRIISSLEQAVGMQVRSSMRPNTPVRADYLEKVPLVKSGQLLTIVAEQGAVRVSTTGKAKSSGGAGDVVTVQNLSSLKEVSATVVDAGTVVVSF